MRENAAGRPEVREYVGSSWSEYLNLVRHRTHAYENHTLVSLVFLQPSFGWLHVVILQVHLIRGDDQEFGLRYSDRYDDH